MLWPAVDRREDGQCQCPRVRNFNIPIPFSFFIILTTCASKSFFYKSSSLLFAPKNNCYRQVLFLYHSSLSFSHPSSPPPLPLSPLPLLLLIILVSNMLPVSPSILSSLSQLLLDPQQLVILGISLRTARSTSLYLASSQTNCQVSNECILSLS